MLQSFVLLAGLLIALPLIPRDHEPEGRFPAPLYNDPQSVLNQRIQAIWPTASADQRKALERLRAAPTATWVAHSDAGAIARLHASVDRAAHAGGLAVVVLYNIPGRDCSGHSQGGASGTEDYEAWVAGVVSAIGHQRAIVIVEPDALAQLTCLKPGQQAARLHQLRFAVTALAEQGSWTYLDAGHAGWVGAAEMGERLQAAGVDRATGFSLNVAAFDSFSSESAYGAAVSKTLRNRPHFVIDTSRNGGLVPSGMWCNSRDARLGSPPTLTTRSALIDGLLWIKTPGLSDGPCNGGPVAGTFSPHLAFALASDP